jgi:hypothetical protein
MRMDTRPGRWKSTWTVSSQSGQGNLVRDASQLSQYAFAEMMQRPSQAPLLLLM